LFLIGRQIANTTVHHTNNLTYFQDKSITHVLIDRWRSIVEDMEYIYIYIPLASTLIANECIENTNEHKRNHPLAFWTYAIKKIKLHVNGDCCHLLMAFPFPVNVSG
jgi:hypothetical protein